ncbi:DMT family transporter [Pontibacter sp. G13]|uniref:DMT family transporter n=1 Tax=Pontibacter sp. G13 TaxID=3074898 RepID=UPI00288C1070|nr:DMT family transporter [Pontibacter sp. G13]WNJ16022.1 DMT family transporter [Pontibacter sp. G13]
MPTHFRAHLALLAVGLIYGANYTIAKDLMPDVIQPYGFILLRVLGATALFWMMGMLVWKRERIAWEDVPRFLICAFFGIATNQLMFFKGLNLTTPINAAIIMTTNPILVMLVAAAILRERITGKKALGVVIGLSGALLLLLTRGGVSFESDTFVGDLLIFVNATSYGLYLVLVKPLMRKYAPTTVIKYVFTLGIALVMLYPGSWTDLTPGTSVVEFSQVDWLGLDVPTYAALGFVVVFTTFFAYLLNIYALNIVSPSVVSMYIYLQPAIAAGFALALGKDTLDVYKVASTLLICFGVFLVSQKPKPAIPPKPAAD